MKTLKIILIGLFLLCLADMQYGFYQLVRFIGMVGFGILAYSAYRRKDNLFSILWISSAILINPIAKISLGRAIWNYVDVIWAAILLWSIWFEQNRNKTD